MIRKGFCVGDLGYDIPKSFACDSIEYDPPNGVLSNFPTQNT